MTTYTRGIAIDGKEVFKLLKLAAVDKGESLKDIHVKIDVGRSTIPNVARKGKMDASTYSKLDRFFKNTKYYQDFLNLL